MCTTATPKRGGLFKLIWGEKAAMEGCVRAFGAVFSVPELIWGEKTAVEGCTWPNRAAFSAPEPHQTDLG